MNIITSNTTLEQREAAKAAAKERYDFNLDTPDRAGWKGGKCPVCEYFGILGEIGACNYLGYDWKELVLFSTNREDYSKPDFGDWEVKAGNTFSPKDIAKGAKYIIWVNPLNDGNEFDCGYATCLTTIPHKTLTGEVEIRGWTDLTQDLDGCGNFGTYYKPSNMRWADTAVAA